MEQASDLVVMISGGFKTTYQALLPDFEKATGACVLTVLGPSMGKAEHSIPNRLAGGEAADILIMVGPALDEFAQTGELVPGSQVELALSPIGMAVRVGDPVPDIATKGKLRQALLDAKSIAYSDSSSGAYVSSKLFKRLGIEREMQGKARQVPATPVGEVVAKAEAAVGFQEIAELLPVPGIAFVGRILAKDGFLTRFTAAVASRSRNRALAERLIAYLAAPSARPVLERMGLEPPRR